MVSVNPNMSVYTEFTIFLIQPHFIADGKLVKTSREWKI